MASPFENNYTQQHSNAADQEMGGTEDNMGATPTGSYANGYGNGHPEQQFQTSQSADHSSSHQTFSPPPDAESNGRYPSPNMTYQQQPMQTMSRPSSGLSGAGDRYGYSQTYQEQNQRSSQQAVEARNKNSVVIKVGMVGDAQIGKTSLMVKYVEGSWDEDYIQTLGKLGVGHKKCGAKILRCQLYGENDFYPQHRDYFLYMGSWRSARVCQHAAIGLQRRCGHTLHV